MIIYSKLNISFCLLSFFLETNERSLISLPDENTWPRRLNKERKGTILGAHDESTKP